LGDVKKPAIRGWLKIGSKISAQLAAKEQFKDWPAFGFVVGPRPRITVLDVDIADQKVLDAALERHGDTPILVRTASGKFHAWYRHGGERRRIRPWKDLPIDLLGGGYVVAPPSIRADGGTYEFMRGGLGDVQHLPIMRGGELVDQDSNVVPFPSREIVESAGAGDGTLSEGNRNDALFRLCRRKANQCANLKQLWEYAMEANHRYCNPPLGDAEISGLVASAWRYEEQGINTLSGQRVLGIIAGIASKLFDTPDALAMYLKLQALHFFRDQFVLANALAVSWGWTLPRFRLAKKALEDAGVIVQISPGGRCVGDVPVYGWGKPGLEIREAA
jgi:hypothetical protein